MSAMKHTPGPWAVKDALWMGASHCAEGSGVFSVEDVATGTVICDRRTPWPEQASEMNANARLIAAAPDLLEALKSIEAAAFNDDTCGANSPTWTAISAARAAIAQATGEQA